MTRAINFKKIMHLSLLGLGTLTILSGCSQFDKKSDAQETLTPEAVEMKSGFVKARPSQSLEDVPTYAGMDAQTMYQIMIAELLISREQYLEAFELMMPIAEQRREPEITQRAFQLAMQSFNLLAMKRATDLLKTVEPDNALTWQASYLLALQGDTLEIAFADWQKYIALAQQDNKSVPEESLTREAIEANKELVHFDRLVLDTASRVSQMVSADKGLAFLQMIQVAYPNEKVVDYAIGAAALAYQDAEMAISSLWRAQQRYKGTPQVAIYDDIYIKLTQSYLLQGTYEEGLSKLARYMEKNPDNWRFQEQYARLEVKVERHDSAIQRYTRIIQLAPQAHTSRLSLALLLMDQKQYGAADALLQPLLNLPGYQTISLYYSGVSLKAQGQPEQALLFFKQVPEGDFYIEAQLQIAELEYPKIGIAATIAQLEALSAQGPEEQLKLLRAQAIFYKAAGDYKNAAQRYGQALEIMPNNVDLLFAQAVLFYELADYANYKNRLERILVLNPEQIDALNALGYYYVEQKTQLKKAEQLLTKAADLAPENYYVLDSLGWLRYVQARYPEAETLLEKALALQVDEEVLIHLIKTKWRLNKREEAQGLWDKYHQDYPQSKPFSTLMKTLSKN